MPPGGHIVGRRVGPDRWNGISRPRRPLGTATDRRAFRTEGHRATRSRLHRCTSSLRLSVEEEETFPVINQSINRSKNNQ